MMSVVPVVVTRIKLIAQASGSQYSWAVAYLWAAADTVEVSKPVRLILGAVAMLLGGLHAE